MDLKIKNTYSNIKINVHGKSLRHSSKELLSPDNYKYAENQKTLIIETVCNINLNFLSYAKNLFHANKT